MKAKKIISVLMLVVLVATMFTFPTSAAKSGSSKQATISVTTKANWLKSGSESITITPKKGVAANGDKFDGYWIVYVYQSGSLVGQYSMSKSSIKIKLGRNKTYKVVVVPTNTYVACCEVNKTAGRLKSYPSWYVSSTCKVSSIK